MIDIRIQYWKICYIYVSVTVQISRAITEMTVLDAEIKSRKINQVNIAVQVDIAVEESIEGGMFINNNPVVVISHRSGPGEIVICHTGYIDTIVAAGLDGVTMRYSKVIIMPD